MPKFSKSYQPAPWRRRGGRPPSPETIAKRQKEAREKKKKEIAAFENFQNSTQGIFDGFDFPSIFHLSFDKADATETAFADDCADVTTSAGFSYHVGADGIKCYFMTGKSVDGQASKFVHFNRSVYIF